MPQVSEIRIDHQSRNPLDHQSLASGKFHDVTSAPVFLTRKSQKENVPEKSPFLNIEQARALANQANPWTIVQ